MGGHDEEIRKRSMQTVAAEFGPDWVGAIAGCNSISALEAAAYLALQRVRELSSKYAEVVKHD